jgi:hypothetical protein
MRIEQSVSVVDQAELDPPEFVRAIGLISTVLGIGKDTLARAYFALASKAKAPSLDLKALFAGPGAAG